MGEHVQNRLISLLREDNIRLWQEPFTTDPQHMQELVGRYASVTGFEEEKVGSALKIIQTEAVMKGEGNKEFRETSVATLELRLCTETQKGKVHFKTKLDITAQELKQEISKKYGLQHFNLILRGKTLSPEKRLDEQNVRNNSKVMVLSVSSEDERNMMLDKEEKRRSEDEGVQRTQKGFQILSERDGSEDPSTTPFLEIADQKGNPLQIPDTERKALIMAMGFHEKGRALMKKKMHSSALSYLLRADEQFNKCDSTILHTVDNYAVLQLDIVWCYQALSELTCLDDAKQRLENAERCFHRCYGEQQSRLQRIKGHTGGEDVLFLRLYLLQSCLAFHTGDGNGNKASHLLNKAQEMFGQLSLDPEKLKQLMSLGFSGQEARLGLRACRGNIEEAAHHLTQRMKEKQQLKELEREKKRQHLQAINTLVELGYSKRDAAKALHHAKGDVDRAYEILLDRAEGQSSDRPSKLEQLVSLGFQVDMAESALRLMADDLAQATQMLLDNQGIVPPELLSPSPPSSSSEEPSTSSSSPPSVSSPLDDQLVNEVLKDIPRHEEDYLDLPLDEEQELITYLRTHLGNRPTSSS